MKQITVVFLFILLLCSGNIIAQNATDIIDNAIDKVLGETSQGEMTMKIVRPDWDREVSMKYWSKGTDYYLVYITAPARDKGQVFMKRENEMWNYIPSINRLIKMPPSMMSQSWMGSDFTNNDLLRRSSMVDDYNHTLLEDEKIDGVLCYVIESIPKPDAPVVWGKVVSWISKDDYDIYKVQYFDEDMELINTELGENKKKMGGKNILTKMTMIPADKQGHQTIIEYDAITFDNPIQNNFFSKQNMKKVR